MRRGRHLATGALSLALLTGMLAGLGGLATPVAAVEPIPGIPLPPEPEATRLPFSVTGALAADLDRDGIRELLTVTIASSGNAAQQLAVQAWWVDADGVAEPSNQALLPAGSEPARLLIVERDGRPIILVATINNEAVFDVEVPCCLTIREVVVTDRHLDLRLVADTHRVADQLITADMDDDGTDELLVSEGPLGEAAPQLDLSLLRWSGVRFERTSFTIPDISSCCATFLDAGETDGVPGDEVLLVVPGRSQPTGLHRVSLRADAPHVERADIGEVLAADALSLETGPAVLTADGSILYLWSWPRDGQVERKAARTSGGPPAAVFGTGAETRIVASATFQSPGSVLVLPGDLDDGAGPSAAFGRDTRASALSATQQALSGNVVGPFFNELTPFFGVIPGGLPGDSEVYVFGGRLVRPVADPDVLAEAASVALLPGLEPVGTVGPAGAWVALLSEFSEFTGLDVRPPAVGLLSARSPSVIRLVATSSILEPETNGGQLTPTFIGVAPDPDHPGVLIVGNEAAYTEISGPPGTTVWWVTRGRPSGELTIGADGVARIQLLEPAGPNAPDGSGATASMWLVTPAGHAYQGIWRIRVYRQAPSLTFTADDALVDFSPTVSGRTVPGATVTINGQPVEVTENGLFDRAVDAGILPTELRVVAVDPVGNRTERVVTVVWPLDYRRLPFVPMAVLLTVGAAAVLFLRRPDTGPSRRTPDDGATFEEMEN